MAELALGTTQTHNANSEMQLTSSHRGVLFKLKKLQKKGKTLGPAA